MFENENLVTEQVAENVEQPTTEEIAEQTPPARTYTQEEVDAIVGKKIARKEAKIRKEYDRRYGGIEATLNAGLGTKSIEEATEKLNSFYAEKGIKVPTKPTYSDKDIEVLARAEAEDIISGGYEDVVEEVDRLANIGIDKMSAKDKAVFQKLAEYRESQQIGNELSQLGVTEDVYNSPEFKEFASKFNSKTSAREIYEIYSKTTKPQKEIRLPGSMKSSTVNEVKDYYSPQEIERMTMKDLDDPKVWDAVRRSMTGG